MKRLSRVLAAAIVVGALFSIAATAFAQETSTTVTETSVPQVDFEPAVPVTEPAPTQPLPDWTYRYMVATGLVIALLVVVLTTVQYFTRVVRKRYRIVEE